MKYDGITMAMPQSAPTPTPEVPINASVHCGRCGLFLSHSITPIPQCPNCGEVRLEIIPLHSYNRMSITEQACCRKVKHLSRVIYCPICGRPIPGRAAANPAPQDGSCCADKVRDDEYAYCNTCGKKLREELKHTEIKYKPRREDGQVTITEINNVASLSKIQDICGEEVASQYGKSRYQYFLTAQGSLEVMEDYNYLEPSLEKGMVVERSTLDIIVEAMRAAVKELKECRRYAAETKEVTITI